MPDDTSGTDCVRLPFSRLTADTFTLTAAPCIIPAADYRGLLSREALKAETEQLRSQMRTELADEAEKVRRQAQDELASGQAEALLQTRRHCKEVIAQLDDEITAMICHTVQILLEETPPENRLRAALRRSIKQINPGFSVALVVHPDQTAFLHQWLSAKDTITLPDDISVETDNTLLPGDCLIRQGRQIIHATLEHQLSVLREMCRD
ncbi:MULTISPECIES: HrpE/YscL family type III secretion apparatus protein [unclassified Morganella (in: enterobacteria)]|uniref:HrpE/YscL family type III secretion apparatus protein n=1 Tax=unclassified Morganella (in: enterobacteria) TaxID=2676694 RepID=UPI002942F74E|nr:MULTISPECIES: HrpE/YscL family type III secretion apparatus protein [unclassified Morganella (in: enterobacteria)]